MKEQFVTYKIALALKELGCNIISTFGMETALYDGARKLVFYANYRVMGSGSDGGYIPAILWEQVIDWFLEEKEIIINYSAVFISGYLSPYYRVSTKNNNGATSEKIYTEFTDTINEAKEKAILKAIELCQKK